MNTDSALTQSSGKKIDFFSITESIITLQISSTHDVEENALSSLLFFVFVCLFFLFIQYFDKDDCSKSLSRELSPFYNFIKKETKIKEQARTRLEQSARMPKIQTNAIN